MAQKYGAVLEVRDQFSSTIEKFDSAVGKSQKKAESATKKTNKFGAAFKKAGKMAAVGAAAVGAAGVAAGVAVVGMSKSFASTADNIDKTSMKLGISKRAFQEYQHAMSQVGVSQDNFEKGIGRLNQRLGDTKKNEKYRSAIQALGVETEDASGKTRNADKVFMDTVTKLGEMEDSTKQAARAQDIFGTRTARELMPAITAGGDAIKDLRGEAHELGAVLSDESVSAGVLLTDTMDKAQTAMKGLGNAVASKALPVVQKMLDVVIKNMPTIQEVFSSASSKIGSVLSWVGGVGKQTFTSIQSFIQDNMPTINRMKKSAAQLGNGLMTAFQAAKPTLLWLKDTALPAVGNAVFFVLDKAISLKDYIVNNWSVIGPLVGGIAIAFGVLKTAMIVQTAVTKTITAAQWAWNIAMNANPIGLVVTGIGLLIGAGILLYKNWDLVKEKAGQLWSAISNFFGKIWTKTKEIWGNVKKSIGSAMDSAKTKVTNFFNPLLEFVNSAKSKWDNFTSSLKNFKMPKAVSSVINGVSGAASKVKGWVDGSHATGLRRVPKDGYVAELHKDEAVLTAQEADVYRKQGLDAFSRPQTMQNPARTVQTTNNTQNDNSQKNVEVHVHAQDRSIRDIMDELLPILKWHLANR